MVREDPPSKQPWPWQTAVLACPAVVHTRGSCSRRGRSTCTRRRRPHLAALRRRAARPRAAAARHDDRASRGRCSGRSAGVRPWQAQGRRRAAWRRWGSHAPALAASTRVTCRALAWANPGSWLRRCRSPAPGDRRRRRTARTSAMLLPSSSHAVCEQAWNLLSVHGKLTTVPEIDLGQSVLGPAAEMVCFFPRLGPVQWCGGRGIS